MPYTPKPITGWQRLTLACGCIKEIPVKDLDPYEVHENYYCETRYTQEESDRRLRPRSDHGLVIVTATEGLRGLDIIKRTAIPERDIQVTAFRDGSKLLAIGGDAGEARALTAEQWKELVGA